MTILVPTDFSPESLKAIDYAASLLAESPGKLHLVHVHDLDSAYALPTIAAMPPLVSPDEIERTITADLKGVAAEYGALGATATIHSRIGRAFDQICAVATEVNADLVVISTHGHTGLKHLFLGSTAERVVQHSPCPVLVVRERERDLIDSAGGDARELRRIRKILVPVDFSDCSRHGVSYAVALAKTRGAQLVLLHTVQVQPFIPAEPAGVAMRMPEPGVIERAARLAMAKFVRTVDFGDVPHETVIETGRAAERICAHAEENDVDLIVTSTHGLTGFAHVVIGSTAEHVVRYAKCPVLVVPSADRGATTKPSL